MEQITKISSKHFNFSEEMEIGKNVDPSNAADNIIISQLMAGLLVPCPFNQNIVD